LKSELNAALHKMEDQDFKTGVTQVLQQRKRKADFNKQVSDQEV
jgi:hypothetical protein